MELSVDTCYQIVEALLLGVTRPLWHHLVDLPLVPENCVERISPTLPPVLIWFWVHIRHGTCSGPLKDQGTTLGCLFGPTLLAGRGSHVLLFFTQAVPEGAHCSQKHHSSVRMPTSAGADWISEVNLA